ncbi:DNA repair protein RadA [Bavariicoccus seileri]|uniref:DNA repair protein RadA n=1 Tax=Bavariicoccus seileri TaxID=549685 RepID=UPI0003B4A23E|nr:DNA repair protein RadA [Bavariicoccus seileri]
MAKKKTIIYLCDNCGYETPKWLGKCPNCGEWNTFREFNPNSGKNSGVSGEGKLESEPVAIGKIKSSDLPRFKTDFSEFNRVLGGGIVPGSLVLIGGDPGIGKSTLLLQISLHLQSKGKKVLYVSGEESAAQIKMRAERMSTSADDFLVYSETDLELIMSAIDRVKPDYLIVDSIQTMQIGDINGLAGSVSQVRETTAVLMRLAKSQKIATFIVGHVTKEGNIAGPRMLEHMVDTVLYFEGEKHHSFRLLRAVKNRFGSTNEIGVFEMSSTGLSEVENPSQLFLEERLADAAGSAVVVSMEGTRPILAEVQCLITPTVFGNARRTTSGLEYNRVALLMAVLEKRTGLLLQNQDAYFKSTGGLKLDEPAIDLAVAISIVSSYYDSATKVTDCFVGEIGLAGELRRVSRIEDRIKEAEKLGFTRIFIPANNDTQALIKASKSIQVVGAKTLTEVVKKVFPNAR